MSADRPTRRARQPKWLAESVWLALVWSLCACTIGKRPVRLPPEDGVATVVLASMRLMPPLEQIARHPWFAVRERGATNWVRWEIWSSGAGGDWGYIAQRHADPLEGDQVRVHGVLRGSRAERFIACLERQSARYEHRHRYIFWPGPNSNTYVDAMLRRCRFRAELPSTAVGKDYRGAIGASTTSGGTGVQLETPVVGLRVGLKEGLQVHILTLTFGIDFWPPALLLPVGEGRLGFADR